MAAKTREDLINQLYAFFISQGFSPIGASYMVGSLIQESRLDPAARQKPGVGFGLPQVSIGKNSYQALVDYAKAHNRFVDDFTVQAHFIVQQNVDVTNLFKHAKTEKEAKAAVQAFENYGEEGDRNEYGADVWANIKAGKPAGSGLGNQVSAKVSTDLDYIIWDLQQKFSDTDVDGNVSICKTAAGDPAQLSVQGAIIPKK